MSYADVTVVVDGAVEEEVRIRDETILREFLADAEDEAKGHGYPTQVYVVHHDHDEYPCSCIEYLQDHKPAVEVNV